MWVLFKHFIIEYSYCKMPWNSPLKENEKGQISAYKREQKSISYITRDLLRSLMVGINYLKDPVLYGTRKHLGRLPKITNATRHWLFQKDNQEQEICKNFRIYPSLQEEFIDFSMNCQISYIKTWRHAKHKKMDKGEMGNCGVFWWEKV